MVTVKTLSNGLTAIIEEMDHVSSAAYELLIPGGIVSDEEERQGLSLILGELTSRGAGSLDSRALSDRFDGLGIRHSEYGGQERYAYRGSLLAEHVPAALSLVAMMVREPMLAENEIDNIRSVFLQDISALEDNPARKVLEELGKRYYPSPYCRSSLGTKEGLLKVSHADLTAAWKGAFRPKGAVLSLAGRVKADSVIDSIESSFSSWLGAALNKPKFGPLPRRRADHIPSTSAQLQIAFAYPSAKFTHPLYYTAKVANSVLSGGMFGRLFIEVREKRGLCYSVYARHTGNEHHGTTMVYAGTTPERAHETLDVMLKELDALKGTVTDAELQRAKVNLKTSLVMGEESPSSRASSNASDWWVNGRVRSLEEIDSAISKVTARDIDALSQEFPAHDHMLLTLGSKEITFSGKSKGR